MKARMNRMVAGSLLGLLILTGSVVIARAAAAKTPFTLTEHHVAWLVQNPPDVTPSGNAKIRGWQHLWYDNADDDRLDGYNTVEANAGLAGRWWPSPSFRSPIPSALASAGARRVRLKIGDWRRDYAGPRADEANIGRTQGESGDISRTFRR